MPSTPETTGQFSSVDGNKLVEAAPQSLAGSVGLIDGKFTVWRNPDAKHSERWEDTGWEVVSLGDAVINAETREVGRVAQLHKTTYTEDGQIDDKLDKFVLVAQLLSWQPQSEVTVETARDASIDAGSQMTTAEALAQDKAPTETEVANSSDGQTSQVADVAQDQGIAEQAAGVTPDVASALETLTSLDSGGFGRTEGRELQEVIPMLINAHAVSPRGLQQLVAARDSGAYAVQRAAIAILEETPTDTLITTLRAVLEKHQDVLYPDRIALILLQRDSATALDVLLPLIERFSQDARYEIGQAMAQHGRRQEAKQYESVTGYYIYDESGS